LKGKGGFMQENLIRKERHAQHLRERQEGLRTWRAKLGDDMGFEAKLAAHEALPPTWLPEAGALPGPSDLAEGFAGQARVVQALSAMSLAGATALRGRAAPGEAFEFDWLLASGEWRSAQASIFGAKADALEIFAQALGAVAAPKTSWSGALRARATHYDLEYRLQGGPLAPAGFFFSIRNASTPRLNASQNAALQEWTAQKVQLLLEWQAQTKALSSRLERQSHDELGAAKNGVLELLSAVKSGDPLRVESALAAGVDPNAQAWFFGEDGDARVEVPLIEAVRKNRRRAAKALLDAGADPDQVDERGETALIVAARWRPRLVDLLLGVSLPNAQNFEGQSALSVAAASGELGAVESLASAAGVDVNLAEHGFHGLPWGAPSIPDVGATALAKAAEEGHRACCEALLARGADPRPSGARGGAMEAGRALGGSAWEAMRKVAQVLDERDQLDQEAFKAPTRSKPARM
jgi:ankyrin repeat protein